MYVLYVRTYVRMYVRMYVHTYKDVRTYVTPLDSSLDAFQSHKPTATAFLRMCVCILFQQTATITMVFM